MSKTKEKKELANKAIADLKKHLGRDVTGRELLGPVEEYVKELRRHVSSDKIDIDLLDRELNASRSAAEEYRKFANKQISNQGSALSDAQAELRTLRNLRKNYDDFFAGMTTWTEEELRQHIVELLDYCPHRMAFVMQCKDGSLETNSTITREVMLLHHLRNARKVVDDLEPHRKQTPESIKEILRKAVSSLDPKKKS